MTLEQTNKKIADEFDKLKAFVILKNINYGNSLYNPISVFQKDNMGGLLGRLDDKLNRIRTVGITDQTEDTIDDLIGYLIHLKIMLNNKDKNDI